MKIELFLPHSILSTYCGLNSPVRCIIRYWRVCIHGFLQIINYWNTTTLALFSPSNHHTHGRAQTQRRNQLLVYANRCSIGFLDLNDACVHAFNSPIGPRSDIYTLLIGILAAATGNL